MSSTHLLVANPTAQSGRNAERIEQALTLLAEGGIHAELFPTLPDGRTVPVLREALDLGGHVVVIAMGGDGTFREVGEALLDARRGEAIAMGMLPTGTANDQGKSFGLEAAPEALARNVEVIRAGRETRLDAARIAALRGDGVCLRRTAFFDSAGWGLSARVLATRNRDRRVVEGLGPVAALYRDHAVYAGALLKEMLASYAVDDTFSVRAVLDGTPHVLRGLTDLVVKGTRVYAGAWVLDRTSRHDDGLFELVALQGQGDLLAHTLFDLDGQPLVEPMHEAGLAPQAPLRFAKAQLDFVAPEGVPLAAQMDGEELVATERVTIEVVPRALRLIVP